MKKIILLICVCMFISVFCGCMKASVVIPTGKQVGIKIEGKDEKTPVIINGSEQTTKKIIKSLSNRVVQHNEE